jgi:hypothetical protein
LNTLRQRLIAHVLHIKTLDPDYARYALKRDHEAMPWLDLVNGIKAEMEKQ